ncbi:MAG TPA: HD domain-containing protein, partial [Polyangiaceae bacterium]
MILRDPVHGLISFESDEGAIVEALLQTAEVQRLRRISQLGLAANAYPGAYHTRFAHAVGAAHVMTLFLRRMRELHDVLPFWQRVTTERAREAMAAAFLHDVGHGPFSHLFEEALPGCPKHEEWTARILLDPSTETHQTLSRVDSTLPRRVVELVQGRHEITFLARAVSGLFDVDRCDYLLRDAHATGVSYGAFDLDWLMRSLSLGKAQTPSQAPPLAVDGAKGIPAIE